MKKGLAVAMAALLGVATMGTTAMAAASGDITICSREDGSGTRGARHDAVGPVEERAAQVVGLELRGGVKGVHEPELVAGAGDGHVPTLLHHAVGKVPFVFVLINFPGTGCTVCSVVFLISKYNS